MMKKSANGKPILPWTITQATNHKAGSVSRFALNDLLLSNDSFHVRIEPNGMNLQSFLDSFQHLRCKFIFQSPANTSEYFKDFGFNTRKS